MWRLKSSGRRESCEYDVPASLLKVKHSLNFKAGGVDRGEGYEKNKAAASQTKQERQKATRKQEATKKAASERGH